MTAGRRYCIIRLGDLYMRLLIAEDELDLAEALTVFLKRISFPWTPFTTALPPYDYASTGEYDAIVLDVMMPKMDGVPGFAAAAGGGRADAGDDADGQERQGRPHHRLQRRGGRLSAQAL